MKSRKLLTPMLLLGLSASSCSDAPEFERARASQQSDSDSSGENAAKPGSTDGAGQETPTDRPEADPSEEIPEPTPEIPLPDPMPDPEKEPEPPAVVFDPCPPAGEDCRVMPLGDSITWGVSGYQDGGYRVPLIKKAWASGKKLTFVGTVQTGPAKVDNRAFPRGNEGYRGWTIDDIGTRKGISKIIVAALEQHKPHIVTLQIGTNDTSINIDSENIPKRLGTLIDTINTHAPETLVVVARIVPSRRAEHDLRVQAYNNEIPAVVQLRADAGKHVKIVDMYGPMTANSEWRSRYFKDDLHPNDAGFDVMADVWWEAIQSYLK